MARQVLPVFHFTPVENAPVEAALSTNESQVPKEHPSRPAIPVQCDDSTWPLGTSHMSLPLIYPADVHYRMFAQAVPLDGDSLPSLLSSDLINHSVVCSQ